MQATWYTKQGTVKALRKSSDSVWPLRDARGRTYAEVSTMRDLAAKAHTGIHMTREEHPSWFYGSGFKR